MSGTIRTLDYLLNTAFPDGQKYTITAAKLRDLVVTALSWSQLQTANSQPASYVLTVTDAGLLVEFTSASAATLTVPAYAVVPFPVGTVLQVRQYGAGQVSIAGADGVTVRAPDGASKTRTQYSVVSLHNRSTDEWILAGDLAS